MVQVVEGEEASPGYLVLLACVIVVISIICWMIPVFIKKLLFKQSFSEEGCDEY
jgi:hypothetical protein